jgi:DNA-binding winged helix-turn-helix (wHTH) protein
MKRALTASVWWEREWFVAQCVEAALRNLREALELHFEPPVATVKQD